MDRRYEMTEIFTYFRKGAQWAPLSTPFETWWRHQMEKFSALLAICAGNSPVPGEFPTQRPVTRSFDVFFDLRLNKRLSKQWWGWWFETLSSPLWRHRNGNTLSRMLPPNTLTVCWREGVIKCVNVTHMCVYVHGFVVVGIHSSSIV